MTVLWLGYFKLIFMCSTMNISASETHADCRIYKNKDSIKKIIEKM